MSEKKSNNSVTSKKKSSKEKTGTKLDEEYSFLTNINTIDFPKRDIKFLETIQKEKQDFKKKVKQTISNKRNSKKTAGRRKTTKIKNKKHVKK